MPTVLNVGLDPKTVGDPNAPSSAFPTVGTAQVQAGPDAAAAELAELGLGLDVCFLDRSETTHEQFRAAVSAKRYEVIMIGAGGRMEASLTPLFERLINIARTETPNSVLCFNTGPGTIVEAVRRWWPDTFIVQQ